jgi:hypothetical protein
MLLLKRLNISANKIEDNFGDLSHTRISSYSAKRKAQHVKDGAVLKTTEQRKIIRFVEHGNKSKKKNMKKKTKY